MSAENVYPMPASPDHEQVRTEIVYVTSAVAAEWLRLNRINRTVRQKKVLAYSADMQSGQWRMTGEPVKFSSSGYLLDGQHRLLALIRANVTVPMLVVWGIPTESQKVMDSGAVRMVGDQLALAGYQGPAGTLGAAARLSLLWDAGLLFKDSNIQVVTNSDILAYVDENPDLTAAVASAMRLYRRIGCAPSPLASAVFLTSRSRPSESDSFWYSAGNDVTFPPGSPIQAMLNRFGEMRRSGSRGGSISTLSALIRTWNAWVEGRQLSRVLTVVKGKTPRFGYIA